jgi:hypothetical protein
VRNEVFGRLQEYLVRGILRDVSSFSYRRLCEVQSSFYRQEGVFG